MDNAFHPVIVEAIEKVVSGQLFGKGATPESVNEVRELISVLDNTVSAITKAFDDSLRSGRLDDKGKIVNRDYLKGVKFFRNPKGWDETPSTGDVLAGLQNMLAGKAGK